MREPEYRDERPVREEPTREVVHEREVRERPVYEDEEVVYRDEPARRPPESGPSWGGYALIKYGFILVMVVIILYFIAQFVLPLLP
jgi:hypothetical protein